MFFCIVFPLSVLGPSAARGVPTAAFASSMAGFATGDIQSSLARFSTGDSSARGVSTTVAATCAKSSGGVDDILNFAATCEKSGGGGAYEGGGGVDDILNSTFVSSATMLEI